MTRHPVDLFSFVSGLLVLSVGLVLLSGNLDQVPMEWVAPITAIGLGLVIAVAARPARGRNVSVEGEPGSADESPQP